MSITARRTPAAAGEAGGRRPRLTGIGKPGPFKYHLLGTWSRRFDDEHRLGYVVTEAEIIILAARYHY
jgi:toxin YoeB